MESVESTAHSTMLEIGRLISDSYRLLADEHLNREAAKLALCQLERAYLRYSRELGAVRDAEVAEAESKLVELLR